MAFVVVEGIDASGKSTLATNLKSKSWSTIESPISPFADIKASVLSDCSGSSRLLYFMAANLHASTTLLDGPKTVVMVRYLWSTIAYHSAIEGATVADVLAPFLPFIPQLRPPKAAIFLTVSRPEQMRRLALRHDEDRLQEQLGSDDEFQVRLMANFREIQTLLPVPTIEIDTSTLTAAQTLDAALRFLNDASLDKKADDPRSQWIS